METQSSNIMDLITRAPWREAVTYKDTWPHEYVVVQKDGQQDLLAAFCLRILQGEGVEGRFFHQSRQYLFLGDYKYWTMTECADIDPETFDGVLNRAPLFKDRRDFIIRQGDTARREEHTAMATRPLGQISEVPIQHIWPNEAQNVTVWLATPENLQLLGNVLELQLELVEKEAHVGQYRLDILAKEVGCAGESKVAIENQLKWSNHIHLGQLIAYAAGQEAEYVVWVATHFNHEHLAAINWLNQLAPEKVWFYAVEVHAIKIGDSLPAPDFRVVAAPKEWSGGWSVIEGEVEEKSPDNHQYREFFQPLIDEFRELGFTSKFEAEAERCLELDSGLKIEGYEECAYYVVGLDDWYEVPHEEAHGKAWVYLWFRSGRDFINRTYEVMREERSEIDSEFGEELDWWRIDRRWNIAAVRIGVDCSIDDPPEKHDETRAWMLETLLKFREVFNSRLEKVLTDLE